MYFVCRQISKEHGLVLFLVAGNVALAVWGGYLAWKIRLVSLVQYNESRVLAFTVYNTVVVGALVVGLSFAGMNADLYFAVLAIGVAVLRTLRAGCRSPFVRSNPPKES